MAKKNGYQGSTRMVQQIGSKCCFCGGVNIGPVTRICFDCHDAELRAAGVDMTPIREGRATSAGLVRLSPWQTGRAA